MELNVGDYVRTKKGTIYQFNSTSSKALSGAKKYLVKSSPNIIDLIEVGDYVNKHRVVEKLWLSDTDGEYDEYRGAWCVFCESCSIGYEENEIKSIVTREQFEAMQYVVGDKSDNIE